MPLKDTYYPGKSGSELTGRDPEQQGGTYMNPEPAKKGQPSPQDPRSCVYHNLANKNSEKSSYSIDTMLPANDGNDVYEEAGVQCLCTDIYEVADQNKTTQGTQQKLVDTGLATLEDPDTTYGNGDSCPGSCKNSMCMYGNADSPRASCSDNGQTFTYNTALKSSGNLSPLKPDPSLPGNSVLAYDNLNNEQKINPDALTTVFGQSSTDPADTQSIVYGNAESRKASPNNSVVGNDNRESGQANGNSLQTSYVNSVDLHAGGISTGTFSEDDCARFQMGESSAGNGLDIHHLSTYETPKVSSNASTSAGLSEKAATKDMTYETPNVSGNASTSAGLSEKAATKDMTYETPNVSGNASTSAGLSEKAATKDMTYETPNVSGNASTSAGLSEKAATKDMTYETPNVSGNASTSAGLSEKAATKDMTYETPNVSGNASTSAGLSEEAATKDMTYETPNVSGNASTSAGSSEKAATKDMTYETPNVSGNASTSAGLSEEAATKDITYGNGRSPNGSRHASAEQFCTEVSNRNSSQALPTSSQQDGGKAEETLTMGPNQTSNVSATATRKSSILGDAIANLPDQYPTSNKSLQPSNACPALSDGQGQVSTGNVPVQREHISSHTGGKSLTSAVSQGGTPPPGSTVSRTLSSAAGFSSAVGFQRGKKPLASISNEMKQLQPLPVRNIPTSTTSADDIYADLSEANEAQEKSIEPSFNSVKYEDDGVYGTIN